MPKVFVSAVDIVYDLIKAIPKNASAEETEVRVKDIRTGLCFDVKGLSCDRDGVVLLEIAIP